MSNGFVPTRLARPSHSGVYPVRYVAQTKADPSDDGHYCDAYAYWDNNLGRWARPAMSVNIAENVRRTARREFSTRQDMAWKVA